MSLDLARKYRPRQFGDMLGQSPSVALLFLMAKRGTVPGALLFYGESGCGKTTMARILGAALHCEAGPGPAKAWPCGACEDCLAVADSRHPYVHEVDAASNGTVDKVREIRARAGYGTGGEYLLFILDEAHGTSGPGIDALLKTLEEPEERVIFVLVTTQPGRLPVTAVNRCSPYPFRPLEPDVILRRLVMVRQAEGIDAEDELLAAIAESARGRMRDALMKLDQMASAGIGSAESWRELTGETDFAPGLLEAAADGDHPAMYAALRAALSAYGDAAYVTAEIVRCLADVDVLSQGGAISARGLALAARQGLADRLGAARAVAAMEELWRLQTRVRVEDRAAGLTLALAMVSRRLCQLPPGSGPMLPGGGQQASIEQLADVLGGRHATKGRA